MVNGRRRLLRRPGNLRGRVSPGVLPGFPHPAARTDPDGRGGAVAADGRIGREPRHGLPQLAAHPRALLGRGGARVGADGVVRRRGFRPTRHHLRPAAS